MPFYDYRCTNESCPTPEFESLQKMGTEEITCPACQSPAINLTSRGEVRHRERQAHHWYANASSLRINFNWMQR
jgi:putative FmdB family regulatory protein